jgi:competence protein ComEA
MTSGARIEDLLVVSGGLSVVADREWVSKNINRASRLSDGQKIYIYSQSEVLSAKESDSIKVDQEVLGSSNSKLININTASSKELENLIGIGPVLAQKIVEGRIYSSLDELVKKGILSQKTFNKIVNDITY